jgi:hypothetical protein
MRRPCLAVHPLETRDAPTVTPVGAEFRVNGTTNNTQSAPSVASDDVGNFVVAWESLQDGSGFGVYARRYDANGNPLGGEFLVNGFTTGAQRSPAVAMDADGDFVIAFESYNQDGDGYGVYARQYDRFGVAQGPAFLVNTTTADSQFRPAVAMDDDGDFVVAWESYPDGSGAGVYFQRYNTAGTAQGVETRANSITTDYQVNPSVAMDADGDFVVAWQSYFTDGDAYGIYARRFTAAGAPLATETRVNVVTTGQQQEPAVAVDADGDYVVAWESDLQDGSGFGVFARRYNSSGVALSGEFRVNTATAADQRSAAVAIDADGDFVVTWSSFGQEAANFGIYGQRYLANGTADGGEFHVNTYTTAHQTAPAVAADADGKFVVVWTSEGQDGSGTGIYGQRFRGAFPPRLQSLFINDGSVQRSRVTGLTVRFDQVVTLPPAPAAAFAVAGPGGPVALAANTGQSTPTQTIVVLSFSGPGTTGGSLDDGNYTFTILANQVTGADGQLFDGNGDGVGGDNFSFAFFRLFGDADGDGDVDAADYGAFRLTFGTAANLAFDFDGDGDVDAADFGAFRLRFGTSI